MNHKLINNISYPYW